MPLPKHAMTLYGGCNCRAIRYRVTVPDYSSRPFAPYHMPDTNPAQSEGSIPRIPVVLMDHCNDCRRATSAILPMCLVTEVFTVDISCLPRDEVLDRSKSSDEARDWRALSSIIDLFEDSCNPNPAPETTLGHYISSEHRHRWFCNHCGTPLGYSVTYAAYPPSWTSAPRMFDIWLGTLDREILENEWMRPDHALWCHFAVDWVSDLAKRGARRRVQDVSPDEQGAHRHVGQREGVGSRGETEPIPRHPLFMIDQLEGDDVSQWLRS